MSDPIHPEDIYQCNGCGRTYPEYVNGCVEDHDKPRSVVLVTPDPPPFVTDIGTGMNPTPSDPWTPVDTDEFDRVRQRGDTEAQSAHFHHRHRGARNR